MIRRTAHALLAALALALSATAMSLLLSACEHYPSDLGDLEPPSLTGFVVTPDSVDITHGAGAVVLAVGVRSPGGADSAVVVLVSPSGGETLGCTAHEPAAGSREAGSWQCTVTLAPGQETGVWRTRRVDVHHRGGELLRLGGDDLRSASFSTGVRVARSLPPTVGITSPVDGAAFVAGDTVRLEGTAVSSLGAALADSSLVWTSSRDGAVGSGAQLITAALSVGGHTLTLTATDDVGLSSRDSVRIVVEERIEIRSIRITPDAAGLTVIGDTVRFTARAFDQDEREIHDADFEWASLDPKVATVNAHGVATARGRGTALIWARAGDVTATASLTVHAPPAVGITAPAEGASFTAGDAIRFEGWGTRMAGVPLPDSALVWTSDRDGEIGTGPVVTTTTLSVGSHAVTLTATSEHGLSGSAQVRVTVEEARPVVALVTIDPEIAGHYGTGGAERFTARAFDATGTEITDADFEWTSSDTTVATVDAAGVATSVGLGVTGIRARVGDVSATAELAVGRPSARIESPQYGAGFTEGDTIDFIGSAVGADGTELPDSALVWESSAGVIGTGAHVRSAALPVGMHTIVLRATDRYGLSAEEHNNIDVYPRREVAHISILPETEHVEVGDTVQLTAIAYDSAGYEIPGAVFEWSSSAPHMATVDRDGVVTGVAPSEEPIRITAAVGEVEASIQVTVSEPWTPPVAEVSRIEVTPAEIGLAEVGDTVRFTARAFDQFDREVPDVAFGWSVRGSSPVASISSTGLVTAQAMGLAFIDVTAGDHRAEAMLVVGAPEVGITAPLPIGPDGEPPVWGSPVTFEGWGVSRADQALTGEQLIWTSSLDGRIGTGERFTSTALSAGMHVITLTGTDRFGLSSTATVDTFPVMPSGIHAIEIHPPVTLFERLGETIQLEPTAYLVSGDEVLEPVPGALTYQWLSGDTSIVSIDTNGLATARGWGEADVVAITNTGFGTARIFVGAPDFESIHISPPADFTLEEVGATYQLRADGHRRGEEVGAIVLGIPVTWTSDDPAVATVDTRGLVTARGAGSTIVRATLGDLTASIQVHVAGPAQPIVYIQYPVDGNVFGVGDEIHFQGWARDGRTELPLPASALKWTSSLDGEIGTGERFTTSALSAGEHTIILTATTAQGGSASFQVTISVEEITVLGVSVEIGDDWRDATAAVGDTLRAYGSAADQYEREIPNAVFTWASSAPAIATVDADGLVTAHRTGIVYITGSYRGHSATAALRITDAESFGIVLPEYGARYTVGETVRFESRYPEVFNFGWPDPVVWRSDLDGVFSTQESFTTTTLSAGRHTITLTVQDDTGWTGVDTVEIDVEAFGVPPKILEQTLTAGEMHICGLTEEGAAYCWGSNTSGQLGDGTRTDRDRPVPVAGGRTFVSISAGGSHTVALTAAGRAYAWGSGNHGIGDGTTATRLTPTPVSGGQLFASISAGSSFTVALDADGAAYVWGGNPAGDVDGGAASLLTPALVPGSRRFSSISAGTDHVVGISGGVAYAWGRNNEGQLGDGTTVSRDTPVAVSGGTDFVAVSAGLYYTVALDVNGSAHGWGRNFGGQLGDGTRTGTLVPVPAVGGHAFEAIDAGQSHVVARTASGQAYAWGENHGGRLGDGTTLQRSTPTLVSGGLTFRSVRAGSSRSVGVTTTGAAYAWGSNWDGGVGDGTTVDRHVPTAVGTWLTFR